MSKKKKKNKIKKVQKQKKFSLRSLFIVISILAIFATAFWKYYIYQYDMRPEVSISGIDAYYDKGTKKGDMRIKFLFNIKNEEEKSKTKKLKLYSLFPTWTVDKNDVKVSDYDSSYSDISDLTGGGKTTFVTYKDIKTDDFIKYTNMAQGIYMIVILRWQSDNLIFCGRTFENHILVFLKVGIQDNKTVFESQQLQQKYFTHWFIKQSKKPDVFQTIKGLDATEILYGDVSRFD